MSDRKKLKEELNRVNELYQQYDLDLRKAGGTTEQRQQMRDLLNSKKKSLMQELGDDLTHLNMGSAKTIANAKLPAPAKKMVLKKLAGVIPFMGAGMAALSGDPAMAAEQLAYDATGPVGAIAEALKPDVAGDVEGENQMLTERNAQKNYGKSSAAQDAAKARGETLPKLRAAISGDRFQALSGMSPEQQQSNTLEEQQIKDVEGDEEARQKLIREKLLRGGM